MLRILFVCYANLCRSPMAEAIFAHLVDQAGLSQQIAVESAGTHVSRAGVAAFDRAVEALDRNGIALDGSTRRLEYDDLNTYDYILAMDRRNLTFMLRHSAGCTAEIRLLLHDAQQLGLVSRDEVRDPFPDGDFDEAYAVIHAGCTALLSQLRARHGL